MSEAPPHWPALLTRLLAAEDLDEEQAGQVMGVLMRGEAESSQVAGLLIALRAKGESPSEIAGFVRSMLEAAVPLELEGGVPDHLVDIVGTGGDGAGTFNISTVAAVVVAAAGVPVAKHGNRAASSRCGSADLLEAWGIDIELPPAAVAQCLTDLGITFLYARSFHPAMRHVAPVRLQLGVRTVFNVLGPLSNPAGVSHQAVGVSDARMAPVMADALARLGRRHAVVFRGEDGLDELTTTGPSQVWEIRDGAVTSSRFDPLELGLTTAAPGELQGGDIATNVAIADAVLGGSQGPAADVVALNAAAGLYAADAVADLAAGLDRAREVLRSGAALELKQRWAAHTRALRGAAGG
ncbi:MAG: anthranilate phosphoribosyltransferase [Nitriliruptoraceae bacterium]